MIAKGGRKELGCRSLRRCAASGRFRAVRALDNTKAVEFFRLSMAAANIARPRVSLPRCPGIAGGGT